MRKRILLSAQSAAEYAILLAVVAGALIAMQVYLKRGIQGRIKDLATQLAPDSSGRGAAQYEPKYTDSTYTIEQSGATIQEYKNGLTGTFQGIDPETGMPCTNLDADGNIVDSLGRACSPDITVKGGLEIARPETQ